MTIINLNRITYSILHTFYALKYLLLGLQGSPPYEVCPDEVLTCEPIKDMRLLRQNCCSPMEIDMKLCRNSELREVLYPALHYYKLVNNYDH